MCIMFFKRTMLTGVSRGLSSAGKKPFTKTIVRPRADQLTSTYTSAQLAYRYCFPILTGEKSNRRALALLVVPRPRLFLTTALLVAGVSRTFGNHKGN